MASKKYYVGGRSVTLTDNDYIAQGGQGVVYKSGNTAIKITHDPKDMIPEAKISELSVLTESNILGPREIVKDLNGVTVGYSMPFASDTEFLPRLFNLGFKKKFGLDPQGVLYLVKQMQDTLNLIHKKSIVVGDYNPNNFLVAKDRQTVYHIDVDNYQTKSFKCLAIMDSVRDWTTQPGHFDEVTDWFSWSIVVFQFYTGIHPFMGSHPDFPDNDLKARILANTSVLNKKTKVPKAFSDFSMIPKAHLDYFTKVFESGARDIAPLADGTNLTTSWVKNIVKTSGNIIVTNEQTFDSNIEYVVYISGTRYVVTQNEIYRNVRKLPNQFNPGKKYLLASDNSEDPVVAYLDNGKLLVYRIDGTFVGSVANVLNYVYINGRMYYTSSVGHILQIYIKVFNNNTNVMSRHVGNCMPTLVKAFDGIFIQELYGKKTFKLIDGILTYHVQIPELDNKRIASAYSRNRWVIVTTLSKSGSIYKHLFRFDKEFKTYEYLVVNTTTTEINAFVHANGMLMVLNEEGTSLMLFGNLTGSVSQLDNIDLTGYNFVEGLDKTLLTDGSDLISIAMKK